MVFTLAAQKRASNGEKTRQAGGIPAVVYGAGGEAKSIAFDYNIFAKLYETAGEASLVDFSVDGQTEGKVLIQDVQHDPVSNRIIHVDLRRIDMNKPMTAFVELRFVGEAPAVKEQGGILVKSLEEVEVKCLPKDLVSHLDVDVSGLSAFGASIKVSDIKLPPGLEIINPTGTTLTVSVTAPLTEEQIAAMEAETADVNKVEVAEKEKKEEEAALEGEAAEAKPGEKPAAAKADEKK